MIIVSTKEFVTHQKKYFDMAISEEVCIKRGKDMFRLLSNSDKVENIRSRVYYEPDEEFYNSITMEDLRKRVLTDIHQWYREINENKNENYSHHKSTAVS